jgi:integrase
MKLSIEKRPLSNGRKSLRLTYYYGHTTDENGKIKHQRKYENLDLYLHDKPRTPEEKTHNKEAMRLAEAIKSKRIVEAQSGKHGFDDNTKIKASFVKFFKSVMEEKQRTTAQSNGSVWDGCYKQFLKYHSEQDLSFENLTPEFIDGFKDFLQNKARTKSNQPLSKNTASTYFNKVRAVINEAYSKGVISKNPLQQVSGIKAENNKREYLDIEELKKLAKTDCRYPDLKNAFLFSCLTGLRWSDCNKLMWSDVQKFDGGHRIIFHQQKTKGLQYLDISAQAYGLLGERKEGRVFTGLRYSAYMNTELLRWCMAAGITKHITFHSARHTFAVTQLTFGTDIYTVSKLLGHSEIKTTQIYSDIIDQQRKLAMHRIPDIGL